MKDRLARWGFVIFRGEKPEFHYYPSKGRANLVAEKLNKELNGKLVLGENLDV